MKIRDGFVSNSSSTSFSIYGVSLETSELLRLIRGGPEEEFPDDDSLYDICDKLNETELTAYADSECGYAYIGLCWCGIGDDETGKEFKERASNLIAEHVGPNLTCYTIQKTIQS